MKVKFIMDGYIECTLSTKARRVYIPLILKRSASHQSDSHKPLQLSNQNPSKMAVPSNWQTMPMNPTEETGHGRSLRIPSLNVYFPNREALPPESLWLGRTIFVYVTGGRITGYTKNRLGHYLSERVDCAFQDLTIEEVDEV